jgi:hypothetical protein
MNPAVTNTVHIRVRLEEATLRAVLDELLPITLLLDEPGADADLTATATATAPAAGKGRDGRWVRVEKASEVDFVAGQGLRLVSAGQIRWVTAGMPMEATLHSVKILLRPQVVADKHGGRLVFRPSLEAADLKNVPALLDRGVVALVNHQLESKGQDMAWDFGRTLSLAVPVPPMLEGIHSLQLDARNATVSVTADAIELGLTLSLHFLRNPGA